MKMKIEKPFIEGLKDNDKGRPVKKEGGEVLPIGAEWIIEDEDEIKRLEEKDPQKNYWVNVENLSTEQNLGEFIGSLNINQKLNDVFEDDYEEFENRDLIKEMALKTKEKQEKMEKKNEYEEPETTYFPSEFQLMEDCAKFKALVDKLPLLKKMRPAYPKTGKPLTDEQIAEQAKEYEECKKNNEWRDHSKSKLKLMKDCSVWQYFYRKISNIQKSPTFAKKGELLTGKQIAERATKNQESPIPAKTGELLTDDQITKQAKEYEDFKKEEPEEFAELNALSKVENKKWQKDEFKWKLGEYNNKTQWSCYKSKNIIDKNGKLMEIKTRYVVSKIPAGLRPRDVKTSFFTVKFIKKIDDSFFIAFIEIKPPFVIPEKKLKTEKTPA